MKLTKTGAVRLYGNHEYRARRDAETAWYKLMAQLMAGWKRARN